MKKRSKHKKTGLKYIVRITTFVSAWFLATLAMAQSLFDYPRTANFIVIEYSQILTMLEDQDPIPLLRIYGDGRVLVHNPAYTKRAGDYEMQLSDAELQQLIASLELKGLFSYNKNNVAQLKQKSKARQLSASATPITTMISDDTYSEIKINLGSYMPTTSRSPITNFNKKLSLKNLKSAAKDHPDVAALKDAAGAEEQLSTFLNHPELIKIRK